MRLRPRIFSQEITEAVCLRKISSMQILCSSALLPMLSRIGLRQAMQWKRYFAAAPWKRPLMNCLNPDDGC